MLYKFYVSGKLDSQQIGIIKNRMLEKFGFNKVVVTLKDSVIVIDISEDYLLSGIVDEINNCGFEVDGYVELK